MYKTTSFMASIKVILWKYRKREDGTCSIAIRITKDRKPQYIHTGQYIHEKNWDAKNGIIKKSHPNSKRLNNLIQKKLSEAYATSSDEEVSKNYLSAKQIKKKVKRQSSGVYFFELATERIKRKFKEGTFSVAKSELSILYNIQEFLALNTIIPQQKAIEDIKKRRKERISQARKGAVDVSELLKKFAKNQSLTFSDIDMAFINRFKSFCTSYLEQKTRTVTNQLIFIRTLYNQAIKENLVDGRNYPFAGEKEKIRISSGNKIGLTKEEISKIENIKLEKDSSIWHTRNVWLFSYYFAGVRISDVLELKWSDFIDGRLYYQMNKNEKPVSLKVPEQAINILNLYQESRKKKNDYPIVCTSFSHLQSIAATSALSKIELKYRLLNL